MSGKFGSAHRHPYAIVALSQSTDHVTAEKSRTAINGDEGIVRAACAMPLSIFVRRCLETG
jgi:hypothetical protein